MSLYQEDIVHRISKAFGKSDAFVMWTSSHYGLMYGHIFPNDQVDLLNIMDMSAEEYEYLCRSHSFAVVDIVLQNGRRTISRIYVYIGIPRHKHPSWFVSPIEG